MAATLALALWYGVLAVGFSINVHWCHGKLAYVQVAASAAPQCGCEVPRPCCKDDHIQLSLGSQHVPSSFHVAPLITALPLMPATEVVISIPVPENSRAPYFFPPPKNHLPSEQAFIFGFRC